MARIEGIKVLSCHGYQNHSNRNSILLRIVISKAPLGEVETSMISAADFEALGTLSFVQLSELRHRGAFSTVAQTFTAFCHRCAAAENETISKLPERWYEVMSDGPTAEVIKLTALGNASLYPE